MKDLHMNATETAEPSIKENGFRRRVRVIRPLLWWLLLVLALYAYRQHQERSAQTKLIFSISINGKQAELEARATLDGQVVGSGQVTPLGQHRLVISHPKAESFSTNLFIWYGVHNLGNIALNRSQGILALDVRPQAAQLSVRGPEFQVTLTNSAGMTSSIPADVYDIEASNARQTVKQEIPIQGNSRAFVHLAPRFGTLRITSSHPDTSYRLQGMEGAHSEEGQMPATVAELPEGLYSLIAERGGQRKQLSVRVGAEETTEANVKFEYGAILIESEPPGAEVFGSDGRLAGPTPLSLPALVAGNWIGEVRLAKYDTTPIQVPVEAGRTNLARVTLVKTAFAAAMNEARRRFDGGQYSEALAALEEALKEDPGNAVAERLVRETKVAQALSSAKQNASDGHYAEAVHQINAALAVSPENEEGKRLSVEYGKALEAQDAEIRRAQEVAKAKERALRPRTYFKQRMAGVNNSGLFDQIEMRLKGELAAIEAKLVQTLTNGKPSFKLLALEHPEAGLFRLQATEDLGAGGWRRCDLVGGQTSDSEVTLDFKVFEYAYVEALSLRALIKDNAEANMMPIHSSRLAPEKNFLLPRRAQGIEMIRNRIREAAEE